MAICTMEKASVTVNKLIQDGRLGTPAATSGQQAFKAEGCGASSVARVVTGGVKSAGGASVESCHLAGDAAELRMLGEGG